MATDDKNNDPEQDDFFGDDDDDFGLPELEYEALDDDSDSSSDDESPEDESDDFASDMSSEMEETPDDDTSDISDDLDIPEDFDDGDDIPDQISDEELEAAMDDEISDEELNEFYEEESFDDFDTGDDGDLSEEMTDSVFDSDGIDEDEFKAFNEDDISDVHDDKAAANPSFSSADSKEAKGKFSRLVIIGVVLFVTLGLAFLFAYNTFFAEDEKPVAEKVIKKPVAKKPETKPEEKKEEPKVDPKPAKKAPVKANPSTPGTVNSIVDRTGNTHVIIASFLDEDMAADYANELAAAGKSPTLIPPFGNAKTTRVAISSYPSLADAQGYVEGFKAEYGPKVWLLKY